MRSRQNTFIVAFVASLLSLTSAQVFAQSKQYRRAKPAAKAAPAHADKKGSDKTKPGAKAEDKSDKLDISDLEQKYWAPKDTDFSVVQNRTYTKAGRYAFSFMTGPIVNDQWSSGFNYGFKVNHYFDERYGVELTYVDSQLEDSDAISKFATLSGGGVKPDYNRDTSYIGLGFNFVPFYAKMSFLGKKIIYFDMQITPHIGISKYEQQTDKSLSQNGNEESSFSYGLDITQYFFFHKNFAFRVDLHNRWYTQDVLAYQTGLKARDEKANTTMFLFGFTYFH